jgi:hypothetical protein
MTGLLVVHAAATLAMTGLIWFVQLVHYPLLRFAADSEFPAFAASYQRRTTWVVLPIMSAELVTASLIAYRGTSSFGSLAISGLALLLVVWLSTALVQVPLHRRLSVGFDAKASRALVRSNWIRTLGWSARSAIALALLARGN